MSADVPSLILPPSNGTTWKVPRDEVRLWPHDAWHFLWHIPTGQSMAFRALGEHGVLLSPFLPVTLLPTGVCSPLLASGRTRTLSSGPGLWAVVFHQGLHLVSNLLSFTGLGPFLKLQSHAGEEGVLHFSDWRGSQVPLKDSLLCYLSREHPETSFICLRHHLQDKAIVKHPLLRSRQSDK